jgi:hypothetical protein
MSATYRKFPPDPPHRRRVWLLIALVCALVVANLVHSTTGIG